MCLGGGRGGGGGPSPHPAGSLRKTCPCAHFAGAAAPPKRCTHLVDGHAVELGVALPVLLQDQQQLLRAAQRHHRQQHAPPPRHSCVDALHKALLALLAGQVPRHAVRGLDHHDVGALLWEVGRRHVPVCDAAVVARVKQAHARNLHQEHGSSQDVAGAKGGDAHAAHVHGLVKVDDLGALHGGLQVPISVQPRV